jgi:hypothetical protein
MNNIAHPVARLQPCPAAGELPFDYETGRTQQASNIRYDAYPAQLSKVNISVSIGIWFRCNAATNENSEI